MSEDWRARFRARPISSAPSNVVTETTASSSTFPTTIRSARSSTTRPFDFSAWPIDIQSSGAKSSFTTTRSWATSTVSPTVSSSPATVGVNMSVGLGLDGTDSTGPRAAVGIQGRVAVDERIFVIGALSLSFLMAIIILVMVIRLRRSDHGRGRRVVVRRRLPYDLNETIMDPNDTVVTVAPDVGRESRFSSTPCGRTATLLDDSLLSRVARVGRFSWPLFNRRMVTPLRQRQEEMIELRDVVRHM